ncbi:MAG: hypothetical protein CBB60_009545, partial [Armatimonadetes bacterium Cent15-Ar3]
GTARNQLYLSRLATSNSQRGNQHRKSFAFNSTPTGFQLIWTPVGCGTMVVDAEIRILRGISGVFLLLRGVIVFIDDYGY